MSAIDIFIAVAGNGSGLSLILTSMTKQPEGKRHRKVGRGWRMHRDDDDVDRGLDRGYRGSDRDGYGRRYYDEDRPRRRVKVCIEYENGDEFCRYRD